MSFLSALILYCQSVFYVCEKPIQSWTKKKKMDVLFHWKSGCKMTALHPFLTGALCLLLFNRLRTALATAQLLHTTAQISLCVEAGSDLDSISDDIPGAAHLTDTFHFLCPCATLSALVHAQTTLTPASANTEAVNEHKSLILRTDPTCTMWCPCLSVFLFLCTSESHRVERPNMQLSD